MLQISDFMQALQLTEISGSDSEFLEIESSDINRPGLQLAGFLEHFAHMRPQLIGKVEMSYLYSLDEETRRKRLDDFFGYHPPCVIICHSMECVDGLLDAARRFNVPVFRSIDDTTLVVLRVINFLNTQLAPRITMHGVLVDVYGVGLLMTGESGVGKSEAALELVKRGHRLVADDVVDIQRVAAGRLVGEAPEMIRHYMEIRGVGIIDIATMYGIGSVIKSKSIDMVVHMENWQRGKEYDRLGLTDEYEEILDVHVPKLLIPIHPGRNLAIVLEVAARNLRLKQSGYNAAKELVSNRLG
ncbi:HPr(Ser) kinase/phosphatase [Eubacteriales bacterium OttesenSCG-928-N13]|nr:HPr(Ser) kinase/phosphatase [Eubacteriales bacterium OttesenSCG-928-N13]